MEIKLKKYPMAVDPAYYVEGIVADRFGNSVSVVFMVDTGAALTFVPKSALDQLNAPASRKYKVRQAMGREIKIQGKHVVVNIDGREYRPARGVFPRVGETGFLSLDILNEMDILMCGGIVVLEER